MILEEFNIDSASSVEEFNHQTEADLWNYVCDSLLALSDGLILSAIYIWRSFLRRVIERSTKLPSFPPSPPAPPSCTNWIESMQTWPDSDPLCFRYFARINCDSLIFTWMWRQLGKGIAIHNRVTECHIKDDLRRLIGECRVDQKVQFPSHHRLFSVSFLISYNVCLLHCVMFCCFLVKFYLRSGYGMM